MSADAMILGGLTNAPSANPDTMLGELCSRMGSEPAQLGGAKFSLFFLIEAHCDIYAAIVMGVSHGFVNVPVLNNVHNNCIPAIACTIAMLFKKIIF